jgi:GT2 family glycosyltransferase
MQNELSMMKECISPDFDAAYYLGQLDDSEAIADPILHYLEYGWLDLLDPSPNFSTSFYLNENPDVRESGMNPFYHYIFCGRGEGRFPHAADPRKVIADQNFAISVIRDSFDEAFYLDQAPFLREAGSEAILLHFIQEGWRLLFDPSPDFSTSLYLQCHHDVRDIGQNPLFHYLVYGKSEQRQIFTSKNIITNLSKPAFITDRRAEKAYEHHDISITAEVTTLSLDQKQGTDSSSDPTGSYVPEEVIAGLCDLKFFDADYYRAAYGLENDDVKLVANFLSHPMRAASPYFDPEFYVRQNPEVGVQNFAPLRHYLTIGRKENRRPSATFDGTAFSMSVEEIERVITASGLFDPDWYRYRNADVVKAGADPVKHYAKTGASEYKRTPNALFDNTFYAQQAPDVRVHKWHPLVHYIMVGSARKLSTHVLFDIKWFESARLETMPVRTSLARLLGEIKTGGLGPNEFFDPLYYDQICPDARDFPGGMVAHYMEKGWKERLDPSDRFSTELYLEANPDVRTSKFNPLLHFLVSGRTEGRCPKPAPSLVPAALGRFGEPEYGAVGPVMIYDMEVEPASNFSLSIAVHLHLYYVDMVDEFCRYLSNIPVKFHLFVSVPEGRGDAERLSDAFSARSGNCTGVTVASTENRGRDVAPFIVEFGQAILAYDIVLHLHSKRSPHSAKHAGWRRYLLHYTLGNSAIVTQILSSFQADQRLGVFQPPYHPEVRAQPKWGGNRELVRETLNRFGMPYLGDACPNFPAGSFFWARTEALRPLLEGRIELKDFEEEAGQIDGTFAHAIERMFGIIPVLRGYSVISRFIDQGYNIINYYAKSRRTDEFERVRTSDISAYQRAVGERHGKRGRIAVVTAITGSFDALLLPNYLEPEIDYFCVTNSVFDGYGVFRLTPCPYLDADPRRTSRYVKTNLLRLFPGYDFVVWVDANVLVRKKIADFVAAVETSGCQIGAISHPLRASYCEEASEVIAQKLDDSEVITAQVNRYEGIDGLAEANLIESNFMVFDGRDRKTMEFQRLWWNEINQYSRRDQISINYCLIKAGVEWKSLLPEFKSTRDSDEFALFQHGLNEWGPQPHIYTSWHVPNSMDGFLPPLPELAGWSRAPGRVDLDVVICVHNALEDVKLCLASVEAALNGRGKIIIVDDASDVETEDFLKSFAADKRAILIRHDQRTGYTRAANDGVRAGEARNVLLLNSDTIVPVGALDKLSDALDRDALLGIVGPLSNAASSQSVPSTRGSGSQTAVNPIPPGMSITDIDLFFERRWDGALIRTPLVHGFCFCVKREVFEKIGQLDEENFPLGYGEENDFCFRAADAGFDLAVLSSTYIFHSKSKSYGDDERTQLMAEGMQALIRKYGRSRISRSVATMESQPALECARQAFAPLFKKAKSAASPRTRGKLILLPSLRSDGLPAGSGFVRVLLPYRTEAICREWEVSQLRNSGILSLGSNDVVVAQRDAGLIESDQIESWIAMVKKTGARLIYEIDDDLLNGAALQRRGFRGDVTDLHQRVLTFARGANVVTVSSEALLKKFSGLNSNTLFIPNALDAELWGLKEDETSGLRRSRSRAQSDRMIIGYVGTPTHDEDLAVVQRAVAELQERFPGRIELQVIGGFANPKNAFGSVIPLPLANDYPSFARWLRRTVCWDIGLVPLVSNNFNANKSFLKFLECSALGMAIVCSDGPEYRRVVKHGETGLLVKNNHKDWLSALSDLVRRPDERARLANNAYQAVRSEHTLDGASEHILTVLALPGQPPKPQRSKSRRRPRNKTETCDA